MLVLYNMRKGKAIGKLNYVGGTEMNTADLRSRDVLVAVVGAVGMCLLISWDKETAKAFVTGGMVAWLAMRLTQ